jgi:hypothetical protein
MLCRASAREPNYGVTGKGVELPLPEPEGVAVGVAEPGGASGTELSDVARGGEGSFGVVEELDASAGQISDCALDVVHLEVGKRVLGVDRGA